MNRFIKVLISMFLVLILLLSASLDGQNLVYRDLDQGILFFNQQQYDSAFVYIYRAAEQLSDKDPRRPEAYTFLAQMSNYLGKEFKKRSDKNAALEKFEKAKKFSSIAWRQDSKFIKARRESGISDYYREQLNGRLLDSNQDLERFFDETKTDNEVNFILIDIYAGSEFTNYKRVSENIISQVSEENRKKCSNYFIKTFFERKIAPLLVDFRRIRNRQLLNEIAEMIVSFKEDIRTLKFDTTAFKIEQQTYTKLIHSQLILPTSDPTLLKLILPLLDINSHELVSSYYKGRRLFNEQRYPEARNEFEKVRRSDPNLDLYPHYSDTRNLILQIDNLNNIPTSIDKVISLLDNNPGNPRLRRSLKSILQEKNCPEEVVDYYYDAVLNYKANEWDICIQKLDSARVYSTPIFNPEEKFNRIININMNELINNVSSYIKNRLSLAWSFILADSLEKATQMFRTYAQLNDSSISDHFKFRDNAKNNYFFQLYQVYLDFDVRGTEALNDSAVLEMKLDKIINDDTNPSKERNVALFLQSVRMSLSTDTLKHLNAIINFKKILEKDSSFESIYIRKKDAHKNAHYLFAKANWELAMEKKKNYVLKEKALKQCKIALVIDPEIKKAQILLDEICRDKNFFRTLKDLHFIIPTLLFIYMIYINRDLKRKYKELIEINKELNSKLLLKKILINSIQNYLILKNNQFRKFRIITYNKNKLIQMIHSLLPIKLFDEDVHIFNEDLEKKFIDELEFPVPFIENEDKEAPGDFKISVDKELIIRCISCLKETLSEKSNIKIPSAIIKFNTEEFIRYSFGNIYKKKYEEFVITNEYNELIYLVLALHKGFLIYENKNLQLYLPVIRK